MGRTPSINSRPDLNLAAPTSDATKAFVVHWCRNWEGCAVIQREAFLRYADWLLARALALRAAGDVETAEKYEQRAIECFDQANEQPDQTNLNEQQEANKG
jgi:tetratricopeptide (TPR) repeat protein